MTGVCRLPKDMLLFHSVACGASQNRIKQVQHLYCLKMSAVPMHNERSWNESNRSPIDYDLGPTQPKRRSESDGDSDQGEAEDLEPPTEPMENSPARRRHKRKGAGSSEAETVPLGVRGRSAGQTDDEEEIFNPVVGWLVCAKGPARGKDFPLRSARNFVGRAETMHVALTDDSRISRDKHAVVTYDPVQNSFVLQQGETSTQLVYLNGDAVYNPEPLNAHDRIELGNTELLFIPLCDDRFTWR